MAYSGYPTPDVQVGDVTFGCVPIFVPNNPEFNSIFASIIYGLYGEMCNSYFWKQEGTMLPDDAAFIAARGLAATTAYAECGASMDCDGVAECIETSAAVLAALLAQLNSNGYTQSQASQTSDNVTLTPSQTAENLLPDGYNCSENQLMATARGIVKQLHESTEDFFDSVEFMTNPIEFGNVATDGIPIVGTLNNTTEMIDWLIQTMRESYSASYNQEVENEIACAIFCEMLPACELSYDSLLSVYEQFASGEYFSSPTDVNDFQSIVDWAMGLSLTVSAGTVAALHYMLLLAMKFGSGTLFEFAGLAGLENMIAQTVGWADTSWTDCDCAPTETPEAYWYMDIDFNSGKHGAYPPTTAQISPEIIWTGDGWMSSTNNSGNARTFARFGLDETTPRRIAGIRMHAQIYGSNGNGTYDTFVTQGYPNYDLTGTSQAIFGQSFNSNDGNDVVKSDLTYSPGAANTKSLNFIVGVSGAQSYPSNFAKLTRVEVWGFNQGDDTKPPGSVWVANRV